MIKLIISVFLCAGGIHSFSQTPDKPFIRLVQPSRESNQVSWSTNFIIGSTCKTCMVTVNGSSVKVYPTGAFAIELNLHPGDTTINLAAVINGKTATKKVTYTYSVPKPAEPVKELGIESIQTYPEGNLVLSPGDKIQFRVKAFTHCTVKTIGDTRLYELPVTQTRGMPGIYQGEYIVKETDSFAVMKMPVTITDSLQISTTKETKQVFSVMSPLASDIALTKGRLAHLEYGLGDDRLGGAKIGYIDSNIVLKIIGKVGTHFKVQLSKSRTAYIPDELVTLMPKGTFTPESLTDKWNVYGDDRYDYVKVGLFARLPYQSYQFTDPSTLVVDIYGATNNTNWITQLQTAKEIRKIDYQQVEDGLFRITISLKHAQHWGHLIYYSGNTLIIKIKHQPENLSLKNLVIAVDAGHGGKNTGAVGATGVYEKEITLAVALKLQKALEKEGAKVIMTRTEEEFFDNKERILFYRDSLPDLLLSVHLNSSEDPFRTGGTSTYYRYIGFKNLSLDIYKRMLELGLKEYGNTGSFNFMLNSPTEYPNALIETLFLSNLEEETKILDEGFQQQMVEKIVAGVKDFLKESKEQ
ncbi:N-acetylmuramoyl-L-alanine amidase [Ferruginibacter paludis]|uniref:N-acetylmuramoyl-L-alanine amidase n=1 Tax=Ferruginibacter paludis TaxID=1310417 RepID=UPI0025B41B66|nr:N-acetylmuramoyl-L-alanine amidase [Ferruginibacter paludis]MDN3658253.1 N-acetylmuramoyl-L-alanine amidase [Ferruginibacter paludis]